MIYWLGDACGLFGLCAWNPAQIYYLSTYQSMSVCTQSTRPVCLGDQDNIIWYACNYEVIRLVQGSKGAPDTDMARPSPTAPRSNAMVCLSAAKNDLHLARDLPVDNSDLNFLPILFPSRSSNCFHVFTFFVTLILTLVWDTVKNLVCTKYVHWLLVAGRHCKLLHSETGPSTRTSRQW